MREIKHGRIERTIENAPKLSQGIIGFFLENYEEYRGKELQPEKQISPKVYARNLVQFQAHNTGPRRQ